MMLGLSTKPGSEEETSIRYHANAFGRYLARSHPWTQCEVETFFVTFAPVTAGTVAVTNLLTAVTGTGTSWASLTGHKFALGYSAPWRRISANASTTSLTLARAYQEATASGKAYVVFEDEYDLSSTLRGVTGMQVLHTNADGPLAYSPQEGFDRTTIVPVRTGIPRFASKVQSTTANVLRVRLDPVPDQVYEVRVNGLKDWTDLVADGDFHIFGAPFDNSIIMGTALYAQRIGSGQAVTIPREVDGLISQLWMTMRPHKGRVVRKAPFDSWRGQRFTYNYPDTP